MTVIRESGAPYRAIGETIRKARILRGLSQAKAARQAGIARGYWIKLEQGLHFPDNTWPAIAKVLELDPSLFVRAETYEDPLDDRVEELARTIKAQQRRIAKLEKALAELLQQPGESER